MKHAKIWKWAGVTIVVGCAASTAMAQRSSSGLEEIVVTATKREASLQDVPMAMQAFTRSSLEDMGADNINDLYRAIPNFAMVDRGPGIGRQYSIRGISTGLVTQGAASVGVYLDEMPITAAGFQPDVRLFDIERVEVLRGPQGTLYGEGSIGGTLRMITPRPDATTLLATADTVFSTTRHGGENYKLNGMLNLPLVENTLALRVSGLHHSMAGYIDRIAQPDGVDLDMNALLGLPPGSVPVLGSGPIAGQSDINDEVTTAGRATLRWTPTERLDVELSMFAQTTEADDRNTAIAGLGDLETNFITKELVDDELRFGNLSVSYDLGWAELLSSTSWYERTLRYVNDTTALGEAVIPGAKLPGSATDTVDRQDMVSEELRLTSSLDGPLQWIGGLFYVDKDNGFDQVLVDDFGVFVGMVNILGLPVTDRRQLLDQTGWLKEEQFAIFGEVSYELTSALTGTIGLRYFDIDQHNILLNNDINILGLGLTDGVREGGENDTILKFNLSYAPRDDLLFWATASEGFRAGGTNTTPGISPEERTYGSDSLWNYEVGARLSAFDDRLSVSSAVYYIRWTDIQLSLPLGTARATVNAGKARIRGAELEISARPFDGFDIALNIGVNDGELTEDTPDAPDGPNPGFEGDRLPGTPDMNISASAQYVFPVSDEGLDGFARLFYTYTGDMTTTFNDLSTANGLPSHFNPPSYSLLNARFGVESDRWSAALFVDNVADKRAAILIDNASAAERITRNRPRTIGLNFRVHF